MSLFKKQPRSWVEVSRTYTPSGFELAAQSGMKRFNTGHFEDQEAYDRFLHGFTNIELRDEYTGDIKIVQEIGRVER